AKTVPDRRGGPNRQATICGARQRVQADRPGKRCLQTDRTHLLAPSRSALTGPTMTIADATQQNVPRILYRGQSLYRVRMLAKGVDHPVRGTCLAGSPLMEPCN